jgi:hypothetical protein
MKLFFIIACMLIILFESFRLARAFETGRVGFGSGGALRGSDPWGFWQAVAVNVIAIPVFIWVLFELIYGDPFRPGEGNPFQFIFAAMSALWLGRFLVTGTASIAGTPFNRDEEPTQYWMLVAGAAAAVALFIWAAVGFA